MLGNEAPETSPPGEIVAHADWYDFEAKYTEGGMELTVPAAIAEHQRTESASWRLGSSRWPAARASPAVTSSSSPSGEVLVNEINTMPGFTETSVYAKLLEAAGIAYPELCDRLVTLALERQRSLRSHSF